MMNSTGETSQKVQKSNQNIQVYVRVRPTNQREKLIKSNEVVEVPGPKEVVVNQTNDCRITKKFTFDRAFGMDSKQHEVYKTVVAPLIEEVLAGYNCTVFAYGQTGTGKTHTMVGEEQPNLSGSWEDPSGIGIIPRALNHLFDELRLMDVEFAMRVSYLELYNEELCDLLSTDDTIKIRIYDDSNKKGSVIVQGLEEIPVKGKNDVYRLLAKGQERRRTAATLMNAQSSRSHTVFSIMVHIKENNVDGEEMLKIGKLNLVDLAGSENISKAGNEKGIRTRETVNINQSLLTLGRVITALVERTPHIPYRESKLTRLLQESLGGRTKTSIIATVSPGHKDLEETLSTLDYAHRAKNIQNKPEINQRLTKKAVIKEYTEEIDRLKRDLMAARDKNGIYLAEDTYNDMVYKLEIQSKELNDKMQYLKGLKEELGNKTKLFEEAQYSLEVVSESLSKANDRIRITESDLIRAKKNLKHSKKKCEEKNFLLTQHMKTEQLLTTQAKELIQVASVASADTFGLHESIDRRKNVEEKVQTACEKLTDNLNDNILKIKLDVTQLTKSHQNNSNFIVGELRDSSANHKKYTQDLKKHLESIQTTSENHKLSILKVVTEWRDKFQTKSAYDMDKVFDFLKLIEDTSNSFNEKLNEKILNITNKIFEDKKNNDEILKQLVSIVQHSNSTVENTCKQVSSHLQQQEQQLKVLDKKMHQDIKEQINKEKILVEKQNKKIQEIKKLMDEVEELQGQRDAERAVINNFNDSHLTKKEELCKDFAINHKNLSHCQEEIGSKTKESLLHLTQAQEAAVTSANDQNHKLVELKSSAKEHNEKIVDFVHKDKNELNMHRDFFNENLHQLPKTLEEIKEKGNQEMTVKHETLVTFIKDENDRFNTKDLHMESFVKECLQKIVVETETKVVEQLLKCSDDLNTFNHEEMVKYEPSGATPARKDYQFTKNLATTSPHDRLIRKFRLEGGQNDLDTSITILEDDENVTPEMNETNDIVNSTPLRTTEANDNKRRALQSLEISKVMNDLNKENVSSNMSTGSPQLGN